MLKTLHSTAPKVEKAILVALVHRNQTLLQTQSYLEELAFLAKTLGIQTLDSFIQKLDRPDFKTFIGSGKLLEVIDYVKIHDIDMIIFDDDLSPSQVKNLEQAVNGNKIDDAKCKILDRSLLILDIFSYRAQSAQAKNQVELAQYQYLLPRLTRMWTHLSKQKGGIGMRGPGEKELETDKRIVKDKISLLKSKLQKIDKQSVTRRKNRQQMVRVALVGYTNVGKSTLMNRLAKNESFAEDKLFATVDSTVRKVVWDTIPFLITDTVGFIRKLPTTLVECFKSTLDEIREADILLHVIDISSAQYEEQVLIVNQTLLEIGAADKPMILIFNKIDRYCEQEGIEESEIVLNTFQDIDQPKIMISATKKTNIQALRSLIMDFVSEKYHTIFPNNL